MDDAKDREADEYKKVRKGLLFFFVLIGINIVFGWWEGDFIWTCFMLGGLLLFIWFYINPWALQMNFKNPEKYPQHKWGHNLFLVAGITVIALSLVLFGV